MRNNKLKGHQINVVVEKKNNNPDFPLVSVIIPVYNSADKIFRILKNCEEQRYKNSEFIFIDDESSDQTFSLLKQLTKYRYNYKVMQVSHGGQARARNYGINVACGDFISFFDDDDIVSPFFLSTMMKQIINNKADIVECRYIVTRNFKGFPKKKAEGSKLKDSGLVYNLILSTLKTNINSAPVWNKIYSRSLFQTIQFDEDNNESEDLLINVKLFAKAKKIVSVPTELYAYIQEKNSSMHRPVSDSSFKIIDTHQNINTFIKNKKIKECYSVADEKYKRVFFSLMMRCIRNGVGESVDSLKFDHLKKCLIQYHRFLLHSLYMTRMKKLILEIAVILLKLNILNVNILRRKNVKR